MLIICAMFNKGEKCQNVKNFAIQIRILNLFSRHG